MTLTAAVNEQGFYHLQHPIFVPHADAQRSPLGPDWIAVNFLRDARDWPREMRLEPYYADRRRSFQTRDGVSHPGLLPRHDLLLAHRHHDGVIWLQSRPADAADADKEPSAMLRRWIATLPGQRSPLFAGAEQRVPTHWQPSLQQVRQCTLAGKPAAAATFAITATDPPRAQHPRVTLIAVRTGYTWQGRHAENMPAWLQVGYFNHAGDFPRGYPDFERFLNRIMLGEPGSAPDRQWSSYARGFECEQSSPAEGPGAGVEEQEGAPQQTTQTETEAGAKAPSEPAAAPAPHATGQGGDVSEAQPSGPADPDEPP